MAGKARVHELAKELGVTSKEVLARLSDQGEFVKSATVTVKATGKIYAFKPLGDVRPVVDAGGLFNYARQSGMIAAQK